MPTETTMAHVSRTCVQLSNANRTPTVTRVQTSSDRNALRIENERL